MSKLTSLPGVSKSLSQPEAAEMGCAALLYANVALQSAIAGMQASDCSPLFTLGEASGTPFTGIPYAIVDSTGAMYYPPTNVDVVKLSSSVNPSVVWWASDIFETAGRAFFFSWLYTFFPSEADYLLCIFV